MQYVRLKAKKQLHGKALRKEPQEIAASLLYYV